MTSEIKTTVNTQEEDEKLALYVTELYDTEKISNDEFDSWIQSYSYKGFDRKQVLRELRKKVPDPKVAQQIILICGLLGPQRASRMQLQNGKMVSSYGIPASGMKGTDGISCQRITAATADLCALFLKRAGIPKRVNVACPAWLQFPSAGSLPLTNELRIQHIEFSQKFSTLIGGIFNDQIYFQMSQNSYCDQKIATLLNFIPELPSSSSATSSATATHMQPQNLPVQPPKNQSTTTRK
jgi:hypothetical protein